ncbi:MAG: hypothetical protein ACR2LU_06150 [Luteitalea sp.]
MRLLNAHPEIDAGVHLALTSEWENVKWGPLTAAPSLVDANGYFFPIVTPVRHFRPGRASGRRRSTSARSSARCAPRSRWPNGSCRTCRTPRSTWDSAAWRPRCGRSSAG